MRRCIEHGHAQILDRFVQAPRKEAIAIMEQISKIAVAQSFPQLPQRPGCGRVWRHVEVLIFSAN
jgi:hypothetical protein